MDIFELAKAKKMFGGGKREGTAIPVGQPVERIYFNTSKTKREIDAIFSQLTFTHTPLWDSPIYPVYINTPDGNSGSFLFVSQEDREAENFYAIYEVKDIANQLVELYYWSSGQADVIGWTSLQTAQMGASVLPAAVFVETSGATLADFSGLPIGFENEKIKNVLSITPF